MSHLNFRKLLAATASVAVICSATAPTVYAQSSDTSASEDVVITVGTRRKDQRSAADVIAPVDVTPATDLLNQAPNDIADALRIAVPSFNVNTQPISDAATIVRPANLRGLSPDNTLVLLNGKRRHRASVISFLGGGIADGAHGPDISVFPSLALKNVQVLRDGASSQYGSDAIAGVINFELKDAAEGGVVEARYGQTYEGDGENFRIAGNIGLPLGENGFINLTAEYGDVNDTNRSIARDDVAALVAAGNTNVLDQSVNTLTTDADSVQIWGQPNVNDDIKLFVNTGYEVSENLELYAWGNYAERQVEGGFFFRNPTNRGGVFEGPTVDPITGAASTADNAVASVLVGNLAGVDPAACPAGIPLTGTGGVIPDATVLAQVVADDNCFSFIETLPGGFVPRFGGDNQDIAFVVGARGDLDFGTGLGYDVSFSYGENTTDFFINNTINASLGPNTPRDFEPGGYEQEDINFNFDLNYGLPISGWASDLNIAAGFEYREEEFAITAGDPASFAIGPLAASSSAFPNGQGFSSSSNGFGGFTRSTNDTQDNTALYVDLEADVTDSLTVQAAIRYEDFNTFGDTTNYKLGGLFRATDTTVLRATYSTGFHAPTTGQANVTNVTTQAVAGVLVDTGILPLNSAAGQFVNDELGGRFTLGPEDATNISIGAGFELGPVSLTIDYFNIEVEDRIATTDQQDFRGLLSGVAARSGVALPSGAQTSQILNALNAAGVINAADFAGSEDLVSFGFFANDFDTETEGVDIVASAPLDLGSGLTTISLALNYTDTEVTRRGNLSDTRLRQLEENLPNWKGNLSLRHSTDNWRALTRINYHSDYFEAHLDSGDFSIEPGSEITVDVEFGYNVNDNIELVAGVANLFDAFPDENEFSGIAGSLYPATAPFGFSGGQYYLRAKYDF